MTWKARTHHFREVDIVFMLAALVLTGLIGYGVVLFFGGT
jgi:hypothetical protein